MIRSLSLGMASRHVRARLGRVALSVTAIGLGVALVVAVRLMNAAVLNAFLETIDAAAGRAAFRVVAGEGVSFSEEVVERVAAAPGVELAVPLVSSVAFPDDGSGELLTVHGVDLTHDAAVRLYHTGDEDEEEVVDDLLVFLNQPDSILLGRGFAVRRGLRKGETIDLVTPTGVKRFTVRGLLEPQGLAGTLRGRLVVMDLYAAERAFTADGQINQIDVVVGQAMDVGVVKAEVAAVLPPGLEVEEPALRKAVIRRTVGGFQAMLTAFSLLAVLAGFVISYSRLGAIFEARTWEVGLLRAVGLRQRVVFVELLKESLLLGAAGAAVGIPLGWLIGRGALPFLATTTALNFRLPVPSADLGLDVGAVMLGLAVGLLSAICAAGVPALRLSRTQPVAALTMRGREVPAPPEVRWGWRPGLVVIIAGLILWQYASGITFVGNVTTGLIALAGCAFALPLVGLGGRVFSGIWERAFGPTGRFAAAQFRQQPRRSALTVATLGVGLGAVLLFGMLGWSFEHTLVSQLNGRVRADLVVSSPFISGGYRAAPISELLVDDLRRIPGIELAVAEQQKDTDHNDSIVMLNAFDPDCFSDRRVCEWRLERGALPNALRRVGEGDAVLVSSSFAHRYGTSAGDTIGLRSPNGEIAFTVAGVTSGQPVNAVILSRHRYRASWNDPRVYLLHLVLQESAEPSAVEAAIAEQLGRRYRLLIRSADELVEYFASQARQAFSLQYVMEAIAFLLVIIAMGDTLATGVLERTREFGMLRAVGLHRSRLSAMIILEGLGIGLLGLLLAAVVGMALGVFWVKVQFPAVLGWKLDLHFPFFFAVGAAVLTLLLCLAASVLPSLRAAYLSAPEALRNE